MCRYYITKYTSPNALNLFQRQFDIKLDVEGFPPEVLANFYGKGSKVKVINIKYIKDSPWFRTLVPLFGL